MVTKLTSPSGDFIEARDLIVRVLSDISSVTMFHYKPAVLLLIETKSVVLHCSNF